MLERFKVVTSGKTGTDRIVMHRCRCMKLPSIEIHQSKIITLCAYNIYSVMCIKTKDVSARKYIYHVVGGIERLPVSIQLTCLNMTTLSFLYFRSFPTLFSIKLLTLKPVYSL